jgi:hypothetical protein
VLFQYVRRAPWLRPPQVAASFMTALTTGHAAHGLPRPSDDLRCYRRSTSLTVAEPPDEEFEGPANSCRSGSGPFGAYALPDVFELWWPSVFTSVSAFTKVFDTGKAPQ